MNKLVVAVASTLMAASTMMSCNKSDLQAEAARVKPPVTLNARQLLGKFIYFDPNISESNDPLVVKQQACASCHLPQFGFAAPANGNGFFPVGTLRGFQDGFAEGAVQGVFGGRKPPSSSYTAGVTPNMFFKKGVAFDGEFFGGLFWDGRATGLRLNNAAAEQALGPFLASKEHNLPDKRTVLQRIMASDYYTAGAWRNAWGADISLATQADIDLNYDRVGLSIADYEASFEVNQYSSKYDAVLAGLETFTPEEQLGRTLFTTADCNECHTEKNTGGQAALFTDFGYDNIGLPKSTSPLAPSAVDLGLGGFLRTLGPTNPWFAQAPVQDGKFRTPSLRNVGRNEGSRAYMHNGVLNTLEEVVHFYNTRDVPGAGWSKVDNSGDPNATGFKPWGAPEFPATMELKEVGNLGLTAVEERAIAAFLRTLTDRNPVTPPIVR